MLETGVIILGPERVGKTKILYKLKLNENVVTIQTLGVNVEAIAYKDRTIKMGDLVGGDKLKGLWKYYL